MSRSRGFSLAELVLAFGVVAVAILSLVAVFLSGVRLTARSRELSSGTEVAHQVMEQVKLNVRQGGFGYLPPGSYNFDGKNPDPQVGVPPLLFPPAPYPTTTVNNRDYTVLVSGQELSPTLKELRVEVHWGDQSRVVLETHLHP
ncbi:MAG: type II secretion system protein [Candidatus Eremiobacterota bacterium]